MNESKKIPTLKTERLALRPFQVDDAQEVQRQAGNPKVAATTATIPHPYLDGVAEEWISKHGEWFNKGIGVDWAIELQATKKLIGCVSLRINKANSRAELGYWIGEEHWGQGFCSEAAIAAIDYAFGSLKLNKITSRHMSENLGSGKVMLKAGMEREGYLKKDLLKNGKFVDIIVYGLLRENFVIR